MRRGGMQHGLLWIQRMHDSLCHCLRGRGQYVSNVRLNPRRHVHQRRLHLWNWHSLRPRTAMRGRKLPVRFDFMSDWVLRHTKTVRSRKPKIKMWKSRQRMRRLHAIEEMRRHHTYVSVTHSMGGDEH